MNTDTPTIEETLDQINGAFLAFREKNDASLAKLFGSVDKIETRLARPGAFTGGSVRDGAGPVRTLKTQQGQELPLLHAGQSLAAFRGVAGMEQRGADFDLGEFCRAAVLGARENRAASGAALVPVGLSAQMIDSVRAATTIVRAGASTIVIDGPTTVARLTSDPTVYQHTEGATDIAESDILAAPLSLNPKTLAVLVPLTVELVSDSPNLDNLLRTSLAAAFAQKVDTLSIAKILADASIPKSSGAQDPAVWAKMLEAVGEALAADQELPTAHIGTPENFIARAAQLASTGGTWLGKPPALAGMRELFSSNMTADTAIIGGFDMGFAIAMREELRIEVVRHAKPTSASHLLVAHMRADGVVLQPGRLFIQKKVP
ncbi:MAG: phage major capsid protein [Candidatus Accumulibacter sp.]|nr:phage major capsid protein [Accumulibacter sp.]